MHVFENDLLKEKTILKEHNLAFANMIANLNSYITQLQILSPSTKDVNTQPNTSFHLIVPISHCKQKIPGL